MRAFLTTIYLSALIGAGCSSHRGGAGSFKDVPTTARPPVSLPDNRVTMSPDTVLMGKISKVNEDGSFVIMTFPVGHLPSLNQRLDIYRLGVKVGEIKVTGPQLDDNVAGDIAAGNARAGDAVRAQ